MASPIKVISLKQVMVDGQLGGPVADLMAAMLADFQAALEQYEASLVSTSDQALAAATATSDARIADLTTQLATATAALADTTAQLATATGQIAQLTPPTNAGIPAAPAEGEQTATDKLAAAVRAVVAQ